MRKNNIWEFASLNSSSSISLEEARGASPGGAPGSGKLGAQGRGLCEVDQRFFILLHSRLTRELKKKFNA